MGGSLHSGSLEMSVLTFMSSSWFFWKIGVPKNRQTPLVFSAVLFLNSLLPVMFPVELHPYLTPLSAPAVLANLISLALAVVSLCPVGTRDVDVVDVFSPEVIELDVSVALFECRAVYRVVPPPVASQDAEGTLTQRPAGLARAAGLVGVIPVTPVVDLAILDTVVLYNVTVVVDIPENPICSQADVACVFCPC